MNDLTTIEDYIPAMSAESIAIAQRMTEIVLQAQQTKIATEHLFHAGLYARTIMIPANNILCGALIKKATVLIAQGHFLVYVGDKGIEKNGYYVLAGSAGRKQTFLALTDTYLTMIFVTDAKTVEEAEDEFTDESAMLFSRAEDAINHVTITGEE